MESLGEMPSATLEAAARKLKDLGNLKQEEVFEMLGKEWGRAVMAAGAAKIAEGASAAESSMRDPKSLVSRQGPSEMTRNKIEKLAKDMKQNGFNPAHPIEVANVNGEQVIMNGHHRAAAAIKAGIREIPVTTTPVSPQRAAELAAEAAEAAAERSLR
jgi:filamentous hemagglutinin